MFFVCLFLLFLIFSFFFFFFFFNDTATTEIYTLSLHDALPISLLGIWIAHWLYVADPERPRALERRFQGVHDFLFNKWYFDELIDVLVVRPALAVGCFANRVFERFIVDGLVSGTEGTVRGAGGVVRAVQNGFVRSYALLLIAGFAGLALYFLLTSS